MRAASNQSQKAKMRNPIKLSLIGIFALTGGAEIWQRVVSLIEFEIQYFALVAFSTLLALCTFSLIGAAFISNKFLRWALAGILASGSVFIDSYQWAVGDFMDYESFITMIGSSGDLGNAIDQYGSVIFLALIRAMVLLVGIGLEPGTIKNALVTASKFSPLPVIFLITAILFFRGGEGANGLPSSHNGVSFALLYSYEFLTEDHRPREPVTLKPDRKKSAGDVVLIVDESIAGAYLDINSETGVYSGLANPATEAPIHNFGLAAAITNCSVGANLLLRYGGTRDNYRNTIRSKPAIWAFAKAAQFETIYIDAQRTGGAYQNLMDDTERAWIDQWDQFDNVAVLRRDHAVAEQLAEYLNDGRQQFILVNKVGAHFPVSDKFPKSHARYHPMLKRKKLDVTEAPADELDGRQSNWVLYRNSYRNTLLWNVGGFFDRLFAKAHIGEATVIYTSDHGQTFHERGEYGEATHCTPNPQIEEGVVPLVLIGGPKLQQARWSKAAQRNHDKLSNYRVFPTLLYAMGYSKADIEREYGFDLFSAEPDPFTFNVNFNARLGSNPIWKHIPLEKIAHPPSSDILK